MGAQRGRRSLHAGVVSNPLGIVCLHLGDVSLLKRLLWQVDAFERRQLIKLGLRCLGAFCTFSLPRFCKSFEIVTLEAKLIA